MPRSGWNATRRNRNIGTSKSGYGQDNRMKIPSSWADSRAFYEKLDNPIAIKRIVGESEVTILIEPTNTGFLHACTPDDIVHVLNLLPQEHTASIDLIIMRQPKRKELIMNPVWGRLQYWTEIQQYTGVAIHLEAQLIERVIQWPKSLTHEDIHELERLSQDGHRVSSDRRHHKIHTNLAAIRNTQLYRTLPHEVGHYIDYIESSQNDVDDNLYFSKSINDKEAFAHRYANEFWDRATKLGSIPFQQVINEDKLVTEGLELNWFKKIL
jgi:hypothetical protein